MNNNIIKKQRYSVQYATHYKTQTIKTFICYDHHCQVFQNYMFWFTLYVIFFFLHHL